MSARPHRAEIQTSAGWVELPPTWEVRWTMANPRPTLYATSGSPETEVTTPWRAYYGRRLLAASTPTEKGAPPR